MKQIKIEDVAILKSDNPYRIALLMPKKCFLMISTSGSPNVWSPEEETVVKPTIEGIEGAIDDILDEHIWCTEHSGCNYRAYIRMEF